MEFPFQELGITGERITEHEITERDEAIDEEGLKSRVGNHRTGLGQFGEADDRSDRCAFHHLHGEAHGRRDGEPRRLRQNDVAHLLAIGHGETGAGFPLAGRHRFDAAAPDLSEEGAGKKRQAEARGEPGRHVEAEQRESEKEREQLQQQRRALEQFDMHLGQRARRPAPADTGEQHQQPGGAAEHESNQREEQGERAADQQIAHDVPQ